MKRLLTLPFIVILTGCPGGGKPASIHRSVYMQNNTICFTINKSDILKRYSIYYWPNKKYTVIEAKDNISLSYPDTCVNVKLPKGYNYNIAYNLNGVSYSDSFFIDNDGNR
ncbi:putative T6SS immunity periplasmic lipoprotein [Leclercia sp. LSNIH1]|uniref:putative T6SS immunity periplasmic lipoprotein n=1 Tax=Leclercia sp. LSNIH1 TaxID=1920114 RepID=UPI0011132A8B|nr:putative T6SS immunity periplasmic lipoprotein [Leclercia sp. LSNIH1]